jgi:hypothetical protein
LQFFTAEAQKELTFLNIITSGIYKYAIKIAVY